jgi:hypothetical protein
MKLEHLPQVRICFVGESFVNGAGDPECLGWTGRICVNANKKGYDITYYNLGVRRETSTELKICRICPNSGKLGRLVKLVFFNLINNSKLG